jgi:hypothetical protein
MPQIEDEDDRPRDKRTTSERLDLLERDVRSHARSLTAIVDAGKSFSKEQMEQLRVVFREELSDAGLRIDGPDHIDDAREDFRFLRRWRLNYDGASRRVGNAVLGAIVALALAIGGAGFWAWFKNGGGP